MTDEFLVKLDCSSGLGERILLQFNVVTARAWQQGRVHLDLTEQLRFEPQEE